MTILKKNNYLLLMVLIGIAVGYLSLVNPGGLLVLVLVALCTVILWRFTSAENRKFIMTLFFIGVASRIIIFLILFLFSTFAGKSGWLFGDSWGLYNFAWAWAQQMDGISDIIYFEAMDGHLYPFLNYQITGIWQYGYNSLTYLLGTVFHFFGPLKFSPRLINCLIGVGAGIFIYYIVKDIYGKRTAKLSAILTVFTPSLFLWSLGFLKDIPFVFIGCAILWSFVRFQKTKRALYLIILIFAILAQYTMRPNLSPALIIGTFILSYFLISEIRWRKKIIVFICLLILIVPLSRMIDFKTIVSNQATHVLTYSRGVINTGGSIYKIFDDKYYRGGSMSLSNNISYIDFTKGFFKGWFYFLLVPFPWKIHTNLLLMSYPQVILWYLFIPFVFIGMITAFRYKWRETFIFFVYIILYGSIIALHSGNIGTVFRHRDMLNPIFLIFGSLGLMKIFGQLENFCVKRKELGPDNSIAKRVSH